MNATALLPLAAGATLLLGACATTSTPERRAAQVEKRFHTADANKDGLVGKQEFAYFAIEEAFARYDKDKDGSVTLEEFVAMGGKPETFREMDRSGNGRVTFEEAKSAKVVLDTLMVAFYDADTDKDGSVTLGEVLAYREKVRELMR